MLVLFRLVDDEPLPSTIAHRSTVLHPLSLASEKNQTIGAFALGHVDDDTTRLTSSSAKLGFRHLPD